MALGRRREPHAAALLRFMPFQDSTLPAHDVGQDVFHRPSAGGDTRQRHLPRVLPIGPDELGDLSESGRRSILRRLARALRAERNRGRAGHWTYDLNRHVALAQAYAAERRLLAAVVSCDKG